MHPNETEVGTANAFKFGNTKGEKIDYIFVEPETEVLSAQILRNSTDERYPSDHFPVTARIRFR
jgi:endonuclease/exonuclease/phosphatase family metal-dependent hydrolase